MQEDLRKNQKGFGWKPYMDNCMFLYKMGSPHKGGRELVSKNWMAYKLGALIITSLHFLLEVDVAKPQISERSDLK